MIKKTFNISINIFLYVFIFISFYVLIFKYSYDVLTEEKPIAKINFEKVQSKKYLAKINVNNTISEYIIYGDQFRIDAKFIKFKYYSNLLGLKNKYKLDRIEGRYSNIKEQNNLIKMSYEIFQKNKEGLISKFSFLEKIFYDIQYGTSTFDFINENKTYIIYKTNTGLLVRKTSNSKKSKTLKDKILSFF